MRNVILFLAIVTLASCGNANWEKKAEIKTSFPFTIAGFISESDCIAAGMYGEVHSTENGGKDWPRIPNITMDRYAIDALPTGEFIHAGFGGTVGMISGGEARALFDAKISGAVMLVNFFDGQHGCAINKVNDIKYTDDAGKTWQSVQKPQSMGSLISIDLFSVNGICILDTAGALYSTTDAGANWSKTMLPLRKYRIDLKGFAPYSASMRFADATTGTIAVIAPNGNSKKSCIFVFTTRDGAKTVIADKIPSMINSGTKIFLSPDAKYLTVSNNDMIILLGHR